MCSQIKIAWCQPEVFLVIVVSKITKVSKRKCVLNAQLALLS